MKDIILEEEHKSFKFNPKTPSISQIFDCYPIQNPYKQIITKDLQAEVNELKGQVCILKSEVLDLKTQDLEIEAKLSILESQKTSISTLLQLPLDISGILETEIPHNQFLHTIFQVTFQKWYSIIH